MTALEIILAVIGALFLLILLALIFGKVRVTLDFRGELWITYTVLGIKFVYWKPKKKATPPELFDLTDCKDPEKTIRKNSRLQKKKLAKIDKKQEKSDLKWAKKRLKNAILKQKLFDRDLSFEEILTLIWDLLKEVYRLTKGKLHLRIKSLKITVGSKDPAETALLYGGISSTLAGLLDFIDTNWIPVKADKNSIAITPDFLAKTSHGEVLLTLTVSLRRVLVILLGGTLAENKELALADQHKEERTAEGAQPKPSADDTNKATQKG